jgi:hypothetical protein
VGGVGSRNATCFRAETAWLPSVEYRRQLRSGLFREDFEIIVLFIVWILAGIMKSIVSRIGSVVMLSLVLVFSGVSMTGCQKTYEPDPDARIPDVPPSTRGGGQGGIPGNSDLLKAKKAKTSSHFQSLQSKSWV